MLCSQGCQGDHCSWRCFLVGSLLFSRKDASCGTYREVQIYLQRIGCGRWYMGNNIQPQQWKLSHVSPFFVMVKSTTLWKE